MNMLLLLHGEIKEPPAKGQQVQQRQEQFNESKYPLVMRLPAQRSELGHSGEYQGLWIWQRGAWLRGHLGVKTQLCSVPQALP